MSDIFLGRCKKCAVGLRFAAPVIEKREVSRGYGRIERSYLRKLPPGVFGGSRASRDVVEGYDRFYVEHKCGKQVEMQMLRGRKSDKPCGARCLSATGSLCECACAGKNHGSNWGSDELEAKA